MFYNLNISNEILYNKYNTVQFYLFDGLWHSDFTVIKMQFYAMTYNCP